MCEVHQISNTGAEYNIWQFEHTWAVSECKQKDFLPSLTYTGFGGVKHKHSLAYKNIVSKTLPCLSNL